jgi:hypothetical protein
MWASSAIVRMIYLCGEKMLVPAKLLFIHYVVDPLTPRAIVTHCLRFSCPPT